MLASLNNGKVLIRNFKVEAVGCFILSVSPQKNDFGNPVLQACEVFSGVLDSPSRFPRYPPLVTR